MRALRACLRRSGRNAPRFRRSHRHGHSIGRAHPRGREREAVDKFYGKTLGFKIIADAAPDFALVRVGGAGGGTIGLLALRHAVGRGAKRVTPAMRAGAHVELSTSDLDGLYEKLVARGVQFEGPPEDRGWERSAYARDPDGYTLEFAQGERVGAQKRRTRQKR
jgi:catechol 2,3-dioxygenase-like lactoylglutathione lyase family enzyme